MTLVQLLPYMICLFAVLTWVGYLVSDCRKLPNTNAGDYGATATVALFVLWWIF